MNKLVKISRKFFTTSNESLPENESWKKDHNSAAVDIPPMYKNVGKRWCNTDTEIKVLKKDHNSEADIPRMYKKMR